MSHSVRARTDPSVQGEPTSKQYTRRSPDGLIEFRVPPLPAPRTRRPGRLRGTLYLVRPHWCRGQAPQFRRTPHPLHLPALPPCPSPSTEFAALLTAPAFTDRIPEGVRNILHGIRKGGNEAAHGGTVGSKLALNLLQDAFGLARWWAVNTLGATLNALPNFQLPPKDEPRPTPTEEQQTEEARKTVEATQLLYEPAQPTAQQLAAEQAQAESAANQLHLTESETRKRLIDRDLARAGWHTTNPAQVTEEYLLPNNTRADYVLWDDNGKPLAVVEAKRTAKDPSQAAPKPPPTQIP